MSELPDGWCSAELGVIVRPSKEKAEPSTADGRRYLGMEHVERETGRVLGYGTASEVRSTTVVYRAGDVLYGKLRPYLNKVTVAPFDGVGSTEFIVFARQPHLDSRYLRWLLARREFVEIANERSAGVQLPRVTFDKLADLQQPIPPLAEQHRIVAKVEALLAHVRGASERLERVPLILKRFRQAVLAAACSGQLTAEWREHRGASGEASSRLQGLAQKRRELWERRTAERGGYKRKYLEPLEADAPDAVEVPAGWSWVSVSSLAFLDVGFAFKSSDFQDMGVRLLRGENIEPGALRWEDTQYWPSSEVKQFRHLLVEPGEIILGMDRPLVSAGLKLARATDQDLPALLVQRVMRFKMVDPADSDYLHLCLSERRFIGFLAHDGTTGSDLPHITGTGVAEFPVPLPPSSEQAEIVRRVSSLLSLATTIEQRLKRATACAGRLTAAILSKAFAGELVPTEADLAASEGRPYEPASVLLERIRHAPRQSGPSTRGRGGKDMAKRELGPRSAKKRRSLDDVLREQGNSAPAPTV
jgi:type I restriction enzyme, S subunit